MFILDRYVLRTYVKVLLVCFLSCSGLYIMVDTAGNFEEFANYGKVKGGMLRVLAEYYGPRVLQLFDRTSGLLALIAAMFSVAWLQRTNEWTAIMAGGIPKSRIIRPLILATIVVSVLAALNRELALPRLRDRLIYNAQNWLGENARPVTPCYDNETDIFFDGKHTVGKERMIEEAKIGLPPNLAAFGSRLIAARAFYRDAADGRPSGYLLKDVKKPAGIDRMPSVYQDSRPVLLTAADTSWIGANECFVPSRLEFEQLAAGPQWQQYCSTADLISGMRKASLDFAPGTRVRVHARLVQPLLDITLLLLGLPLVVGNGQRNVFLAIGMSILVVTSFLVVTLASHGLGSISLFSPAVAAWLPLLIFIPAAAGLSPRIWES